MNDQGEQYILAMHRLLDGAGAPGGNQTVMDRIRSVVAENADLRAQLATATSTIAEQPQRADAAEGEAKKLRGRVDELTDQRDSTQRQLTDCTNRVREMNGFNATERATRIAAEGREAGLREALEEVRNVVSLCFPGSTKDRVTAIVTTALATPANGAAIPNCACGQRAIYGSRDVSGSKPGPMVWLCGEHLQETIAAWQKREGETDATNP